jgi:Fe-S cluster assembly protein SufD
VDDGAEIAGPVELQSLHDGGQVHTRNLVTVGEGAKVTLSTAMRVPRRRRSGEQRHRTDLRKGAEAMWVTVQEQGETATHLGQLNVTLEETPS